MSTLKQKFTETKILGMPAWMYLVVLVVTWIVGFQEAIPNNMVGALCFAVVFGAGVGFIGDHIPVWKDWLGGGMLLTSLVAGALNTFHFIPQSLVDTLNNFNGSTGFLNLYILVLITGSVLSVNRKLLLKSFGGYIPCILAAVAGAFVLAGLAGMVTGVGAMDAIMTYALPIMGGGNGAGAVPMSKIWGEVTGQDSQSWYASAFAILSLGNLVAVVYAALLNRLGQKKPGLTGNGELMKTAANMVIEEENYKPVLSDYAAGLALGLFCFVFSGFYSSKLSIINHADLGFTIHQFAFMIILVAILNMTGIVPANVRAGTKGMQQFFVKHMSLPLMVTVGIGTNLMDYVKVFSLKSMIIIVAVVTGAVIGSWLVAPLFKFHRIECTITSALCMANGGGAGDIQVLGAANRMELMSYAQISSRIGGAIMLIIASFMFGKFL